MEEKVKELRVIAANELLQSNCDALASPPTHLLASSSVIRSPQPSTSSNSESFKNLFYQNRDGNPVSQVVQLNHGEVFSEDTSEIENYYSAVNASNIEPQQHQAYSAYFKINMTVILTILLFLILKMMRFLLANHSLIISLCTVCLFQICGQLKCFEDYRNTYDFKY
ncbi:uncharacterized protein LOC124193996 [Daphnia pulex]|uniref:uncharacterized protein LOC124193996 n=1 Tax=Daphnia pulex TaxID=6669 RepID=UPI001EE0B9E6|nr:uncharacterized protein LOC124193996 [Daphnia pulex]